MVANGADLALLAVENLLSHHRVKVHKLELVTQTLTSLVEKEKENRSRTEVKVTGPDRTVPDLCVRYPSGNGTSYKTS